MNASQRGRSNRNRGLTAERDVAKWLRCHGFPHAERSVKTGMTTADRAVADEGDLTGTPGLVWQVKCVAREDITGWMAETEQQRLAADANVGILIQRRAGKSDPGRWWAWIPASDLGYLATTAMGGVGTGFPVRMELAHLVPLLHDRGYGTPMDREVAA